ncbi:MAG: hypothetical protein ACE5E0_02130 [Terriglobia bacterium]
MGTHDFPPGTDENEFGRLLEKARSHGPSRSSVGWRAYRIAERHCSASALQTHRLYGLNVDSAAVADRAMARIQRGITDGRVRPVGNHPLRSFEKLVRNTARWSYLDLLRTELGKISPEDSELWRAALDSEIDFGWLEETARRHLSLCAAMGCCQSSETVLPVLFKDRLGRVLGVQEAARMLAAKMIHDAKYCWPPHFLTGKYKIRQGGHEGESLGEEEVCWPDEKPASGERPFYLDDVFTAVAAAFLQAVNHQILPELKRAVRERILFKIGGIPIVRSRDPHGPDTEFELDDEEGADREAARRLLKNLVAMAGADLEPHKVMVTVMQRCAGWTDTGIIEEYSFADLSWLYKAFAEKCRDSFGLTDLGVLGPLWDKLQQPEAGRDLLSAEEIKRVRRLPGRGPRDTVLLFADHGQGGQDNRPRKEKLLGEFLARTEPNSRGGGGTSAAEVLETARSRIQNWIRGTQRWAGQNRGRM